MVGLGRHAGAKYVTGTRLGNSHGLGWEGLVVERWRHSEGDLGAVEVKDTEVIVMLRGRLHVRRRGDGRLQHHDALPGAVWLCPSGVREDMIHLYGEVEESLHFHLPPAAMSAAAVRELDVDPARVQLHYDGGFRDPLVEQIAWAVHAEMTAVAPHGRILVETLAAALRVQMLRHHSNLDPAHKRLPRVRGALDARRLQRIAEYVDSHLSEDLSIGALARQACLSPYHFARAFKSATGVAPHRYLMQRRVSTARRLVGEGRLPLAAIADICGFSSQAHLTRWFKRIVGVTPGAYRRT